LDAGEISGTSTSILLSSSPSDETDNSSFESFGDFGDFQSADEMDTDFGPFAIGDSTSLSGASNISMNYSGAAHARVNSGDEDHDDDSSLMLTPTSGSWTIANGYDGFEEITRV